MATMRRPRAVRPRTPPLWLAITVSSVASSVISTTAREARVMAVYNSERDSSAGWVASACIAITTTGTSSPWDL